MFGHAPCSVISYKGWMDGLLGGYVGAYLGSIFFSKLVC